jgi:hypothetical protein
MKRFGRISILTLSIVGLSLILGIATSHRVRAAVSALVTVSNTAANPVPVQGVDAKNAVQYDLALGYGSQPVPIPSGQRLVVDFVTINGVAQSLSGPIQPSIIFQSSLNGGSPTNFYLEPGPSPVNIPGENQLYLAQPLKVYADSLYVSGGFAGFDPSTFIFNVAISGHLVPIP